METILPLTLRQLQRPELEEAARLLGRGMRDNPANIRAFGIRDVERRSQALARFFGPVLGGLELSDMAELRHRVSLAISAAARCRNGRSAAIEAPVLGGVGK